MSSVTLTKSLCLKLLSTPTNGSPAIAEVQLSRINAQKLASALTAYALGSQKEKGDTYIPAEAVRSSVVRLNSNSRPKQLTPAEAEAFARNRGYY